MREARKNLLSSISYHATGIRLELFRKVEQYLTDTDTTRKTLAERIGVSKGYVSQVLNGTANLSISKLVQFSLAIGLVPVISWVPIERYLAVNGRITKLIGNKEKIVFAEETQISKMLQNMQSAHAAKYIPGEYKEIEFSNQNSFKQQIEILPDANC